MTDTEFIERLRAIKERNLPAEAVFSEQIALIVRQYQEATEPSRKSNSVLGN